MKLSMKIRINNPDHSVKVQSALHKLGYNWLNSINCFERTEAKFLYANDDGNAILWDNNDGSKCVEYELFEGKLVKVGEYIKVPEVEIVTPILRPKSMVDNLRIIEILEAFEICLHDGKKVPKEWIEEFTTLIGE